MSGTRWTEPGQGADTHALWDAIGIYRDGHADSETSDADANLNRLTPMNSNYYGVRYRTNLALTGEPLTAEDVRNIGECK